MKNATKVLFLLDRTGSMATIQQATIDAFNEYINGLRTQPGDCQIKLVQFDDIGPYEVVFDKPLADVPKLTDKTFIPRGNTPLHDAMGRAIVSLGEELAAMNEADRPDKVVMVTLTDGYENASHEYTQQRIAEMIDHQRDKYGWDFTFLGANQDAVLTAQGFNIPAAKAMTYNANYASTFAVGQSMATYTNSVRSLVDNKQVKKVAFSDKDRRKVRQ